MALAARVEGDLRIAGNLTVDGTVPTMARSNLIQNPAAKFAIPLTEFRVWDALATNLPATSATDDLGLYGGTFASASPTIATGDVKNTTVTRYARFQCVIPVEYDAAETLTLRFSAGMQTTVASASATIDVQAYKSDREVGIGADICATAAQSINSLTFGNKDFTITPSGLTAGDVLDVRITIYVEDSATATAVIGTIGAVDLLVDIKG
ncbi:MAG TPA: hypothetical protein VMX74_03815 [Pirellulales bacterium]|nr:hypothetical protein [Pirellulales bacterium]